MDTLLSPTALDRLLEPVGACLTPEMAERLAAVRADPVLAERMEVLAARNTEGLLTPAERVDYESYVRGLTFVGALQLRARSVLASNASG